ncbi:ABC transporter ATP-binding protein [Natronincola ferrireducens]|uniref:Oligopeptide transport system ATP-binding protein n=1 Tax=Natronincola ferrireducens TaxID=393762 RepID=A0A1G9E4K7_9FIRM|nr:dipeptide ABC transporter ATP-binding protein [Natronincola ferrireducens]SDK71038.1 oligopeptide transport system ATP-binding protein [Natronincola ferrireducens]
MKDTIMAVENLTKTFKIQSNKLFTPPKYLKAVNNVSFEVYKGETLGIIGESGCGKSTLGKSILRLIHPSSGKVRYEDILLSELSEKEMKNMRKDIQIIFQDPYSSLDPRKTVGSLIEEPMKIHNIGTPKERKERVSELLQMVGLDEYHGIRYPHEFSGGQRQRINVARALALNPKLIVCDEPVSALDVSVQAQVLNLLKTLQQKLDLTYVFISHDLSVVKYISDRIAIMYLGRIVEMGDSQEIYKNPLHPYTRALFSAIPPENPMDKKEKIKLKGEIPSPLNLPSGCPFSGRCPNYMKECKEILPELKDVKEGHKVACLLHR